MKVQPPKVKDVKLFAARKQMSMKGSIVGPIKLRIGPMIYHECVYVAPISQQMLFGFDILHDKAILNIRNDTLDLDGHVSCC